MGLKNRYIEKQRDLSMLGIRPEFPRMLKIDICNMCNYSCIFCPQSKQSGKTGSIDRELCRKIIRDAYRAGARELCLSMTGEPLLNKDLEGYISFSKELGYEYVFLNTNGYLCDEKRGVSLLEAGLDSIKFSVNSSEKSYYLVHGVHGFERVINNIRAFYRNRDRLNSRCRVYISYVSVRQTQGEADVLWEMLREFSDEMIVMKANNRAGSISEIEADLFAGNDEYSFSYPCSQIFNNVYVTAEGYMIICCQDFENLTVVADLHEENVEEAWNNEKFTAFRKRYLEKDLKGTLCYNCIHNCNEKVIPLTDSCIKYSIDAVKEKKLNDRISELVNRQKNVL